MTSFRIQVLLRIFLVFLFGMASYYVITELPQFWLLFGWLILFSVLSFISLVRYVERSNRDLSLFLLAIKQNDFSNVYPEHNSKSKALHHAFNVITREFIKLRGEKESNFQFLKAVVEHSGVPLIAYQKKTSKVSMINQSAKDLFHIPHLTRIEALRRISPPLLEEVKTLSDGEKTLQKTTIGDEQLYLTIMAKELKLMDTDYKVLAFHDINSELDQKEIESWQKLIRVMTHEIKNSVIPIATLSEVMNQMFHDYQQKSGLHEIDQEDEADLLQSMQTIENRSKGLAQFVSSYGDLARLPKPQLETINIGDVVNRVIDLEATQVKSGDLKILAQLPDQDVVKDADPNMLEQVLINLVKNAIEALDEQESGQITIKVQEVGDQVRIVISDNGPGMDQETLDNIFVPFFTTKKEGSGIGLSLSRQIVRAHQGRISVTSTPGEGTTFEILF